MGGAPIAGRKRYCGYMPQKEMCIRDRRLYQTSGFATCLSYDSPRQRTTFLSSSATIPTASMAAAARRTMGANTPCLLYTSTACAYERVFGSEILALLRVYGLDDGRVCFYLEEHIR